MFGRICWPNLNILYACIFNFHTNCNVCMHTCGWIRTLLYKLCCVWTVAHSTTSHLVDPYYRLMAASMMLVSAQAAITLPRSCTKYIARIYHYLLPCSHPFMRCEIKSLLEHSLYAIKSFLYSRRHDEKVNCSRWRLRTIRITLTSETLKASSK